MGIFENMLNGEESFDKNLFRRILCDVNPYQFVESHAFLKLSQKTIWLHNL